MTEPRNEFAESIDHVVDHLDDQMAGGHAPRLGDEGWADWCILLHHVAEAVRDLPNSPLYGTRRRIARHLWDLGYRERSLPWSPEDGDARCQKCGRDNPVWSTPDDLWNQVMGNEGGCLCPPCFIAEAEASGVPALRWRLTYESKPTTAAERGGENAGEGL